MTDMVEDVLEQVGRRAVGVVGGVRLVVTVEKGRNIMTAGVFFPRKPKVYWRVNVNAPDSIGDSTTEYPETKEAAMALFDSLVAKYSLFEGPK